MINKFATGIGGLVSTFSFIQETLINYKNDSLRIVYYHMVTDRNHDYYFDNKAIRVNEFRAQIKFFKKHYNIISLSEAVQLAENERSFTKNLVITFDDGFKENYSVIAPILLEEKITATFFIITNCIDNKDLMWRNKLLLIKKFRKGKLTNYINDIANLYSLPFPKGNQDLMSWSFNEWPMKHKEEIINLLWSRVLPYSVSDYLAENLPYCTANEIKELSDSNFEIGTHSLSHPVFNKIDLELFHNEISQSAKIISEITKSDVKSFSYPFGVRAELSKEKEYFNKQGAINVLLGIKNKLNNYGENLNYWERDNLEFSNSMMMFRFFMLPIIRKIFNAK